MPAFPRVAALGCLLCAAMQAEEWTEARVLELFLAQQPIQREARARQAIAEAESRGRTLYANPTVSVTREGAGHTEFYQAGQTLPLSRRLPLLRAAGSHQAQAAEADGAFILWQARSALRGAFYRVMAAQERARVLAAADEDFVRILAILEHREREGEGSKLDRLRAERERADWQADAGAVKALGEWDKGELLAYLPPATAIDAVTGTLETRPAGPALPDLLARALARRPDLEAERQRTSQFRFEQRAAERLRIPEPTVIAGLKRAEAGMPGIANGAVVGVSLALPLFNQGKTEAARWAAEQQRANARLDQLTRRVSAGVEAAWRALAARRATRDAYERSVAGGEELTRISLLAYQEGEIGILQLLDAYRWRRASQLRRVDLALAVKEAQILLESLAGEELPQ